MLRFTIFFRQDGFYIDGDTKDVAVRLLLYNGELKVFCSVSVLVGFNLGGRVTLDYDVQSFSVENYEGSEGQMPVNKTLKRL